MRSLVVLFALLLGLTDCVIIPDDLVFDVDPGFTSTQVAALYSAADRWNAVSNHHISFAEDAPYHAELHDPGPGIDGQKHGDTIYIKPGLSDDRFLVVATHEMGHILGLDHTTRGLMTPSGEQLEFSPEDLTECRRVEACD